jgi:hypothetical protein
LVPDGRRKWRQRRQAHRRARSSRPLASPCLFQALGPFIQTRCEEIRPPQAAVKSYRVTPGESENSQRPERRHVMRISKPLNRRELRTQRLCEAGAFPCAPLRPPSLPTPDFERILSEIPRTTRLYIGVLPARTHEAQTKKDNSQLSLTVPAPKNLFKRHRTVRTNIYVETLPDRFEPFGPRALGALAVL